MAGQVLRSGAIQPGTGGEVGGALHSRHHQERRKGGEDKGPSRPVTVFVIGRQKEEIKHSINGKPKSIPGRGGVHPYRVVPDGEGPPQSGPGNGKQQLKQLD